jgi:hypothetical protein
VKSYYASIDHMLPDQLLCFCCGGG